MTAPPDEDLVARAQGGDADGFAALAERHGTTLTRFAALLLGDPHEAESVAQEALTRAFEGLGKFRAGEAFYPWVRGIALNLCREHLRRRSRHARPTDPGALAPAPTREGRRQGVLSALLRDEQSARVWSAVGQLPEAYREAVVLHYVEGLSYDEIARLTGVSAGVLRVRALRGRALLRGELGGVVDTWLRGDAADGQESA